MPVEEELIEVKQAFDPSLSEPDYQKEAFFHNIFKTYNSEPHSEQEWLSTTSKVSNLSNDYTIQVGDTLWDISVTLFAEGFYWPKIWALNREITNPHSISQGQIIRFFPGTFEEAPRVEIVDPDVIKDEKVLQEKLASLDIIPPPSKTYKPPLKDWPRSIPQYHVSNKSEYDNLGVSLDLVRREQASTMIKLNNFVDLEIRNVQGEIVETELGFDTASEFQYVIVEMNEEQVQGLYLVLRSIGSIKDTDNMTKTNAQIIEVQGILEIVDKVNEYRNLYRALVKRVVNPITVGSKLVIGEIPVLSLNDDRMVSETVSLIIGGQFEEKRKIFGTNGVVFINKGSESGISKGELYNIFANQQIRIPGSKVEKNTRIIGKLVIAHVGLGYATGVIINSSEEIRVGDIVAGSSPVTIETSESMEEFGFESDFEDDFEDDLQGADESIESETLWVEDTQGKLQMSAEEQSLEDEFNSDDFEFSDDEWNDGEDEFNSDDFEFSDDEWDDGDDDFDDF